MLFYYEKNISLLSYFKLRNISVQKLGIYGICSDNANENYVVSVLAFKLYIASDYASWLKQLGTWSGQSVYKPESKACQAQ